MEQVVYTPAAQSARDTGSDADLVDPRPPRLCRTTETQMITYEDAGLRVESVPVLYLPWFAHPGSDGGAPFRASSWRKSRPFILGQLGAFVETHLTTYWSILAQSGPSRSRRCSPQR